jgi:anti-sigma regulatory factor (Ser/Thr protein kinase)
LGCFSNFLAQNEVQQEVQQGATTATREGLTNAIF